MCDFIVRTVERHWRVLRVVRSALHRMDPGLTLSMRPLGRGSRAWPGKGSVLYKLGAVTDGLWGGHSGYVLLTIVSKAKDYSKEGRLGRTWGRKWAEPKEGKHQSLPEEGLK